MPPKTFRSKNANDEQKTKETPTSSPAPLLRTISNLQAKIDQLKMEKSDLQDALRRTQFSLEHMEASKPKPKANIDWSFVFNKKKENLELDINGSDTDHERATSDELSGDEEIPSPSESETDETTEG